MIFDPIMASYSNFSSSYQTLIKGEPVYVLSTVPVSSFRSDNNIEWNVKTPKVNVENK